MSHTRETGRNCRGNLLRKIVARPYLEGTLIAMLSIGELSRCRDARSRMQYAVA
jgi:hypothetical protein